MLWEDLTARNFPQAVRKAKGVCVIPLGIMEKHGEHLPLGTDYFVARYTAEKAADREPVVVFPPYYFTQIHEAKHQPGTIALSVKIIWDLLAECCDEIHRNGFNKIILHNCHGGNNDFLQYFTFMMLERKREYVVYLPYEVRDQTLEKQLEKIRKGKKIFDAHAGHGETSMILVIRPHTVHMDAIPVKTEFPLKRLSHLPSVKTPIWWYADYPNHYAGNARTADTEEGKMMLESMTNRLIAVIKAVKKDKEALRLQKEFYSRLHHQFVR
jgi:creatinine amidohydrolase